MAPQYTERELKAGELRKGMILRRWAGVKGPIDCEVRRVTPHFYSVAIELMGRTRQVVLKWSTPVVIREKL